MRKNDLLISFNFQTICLLNITHNFFLNHRNTVLLFLHLFLSFFLLLLLNYELTFSRNQYSLQNPSFQILTLLNLILSYSTNTLFWIYGRGLHLLGKEEWRLIAVLFKVMQIIHNLLDDNTIV